MTDGEPREETSPVTDPSEMRGLGGRLLYALSLPERTVRSAAGVAGGAIRESAAVLIPQAFQNSRTYGVMVRQTLDFLAEDVGGVKRQGEPLPAAGDLAGRRAVGSFLDMASSATLHLSPLVLLAVVSDVAYGSRVYLKELADELKQQGLIAPDSTIGHVDDLLGALAATAHTASAAFETPPLSVEGLQQTIDEARQAAASIDVLSALPQAEVERLWNEIHETATAQGVNPLTVSTAMTLMALDKIGTLGHGALSTARAAGSLLNRHVLGHYADALGRIQQRGIYASLAAASQPYIEAVWENFSPRRSTITEDLLSGKLAGQAWDALSRWWMAKPPPEPEGPAAS